MPGPVAEPERGDEVGARDPVAAVEAGAVVERAVGGHAELGELRDVAAAAGRGRARAARLDPELLGEQLGA